MASIDIESLYTSIPLDETIEILTSKAFEKGIIFKGFTEENFKKFLELTLKDTLLKFNDKIYRQRDGLAMGGPASGQLANVFLCHHETNWLDQCPLKFRPVLYKRFADDTFLLFRDKSHIAPFVDYLNKQHPAMRFTSETEQNNTLSFLGINVNRENNNFTTSVFRKNTFTGLATNFSSFIPHIFKINLIRTLVYRAYSIYSDAIYLKTECEFLKTFMSSNGIPEILATSQIKKKPSQN